MEITPRSACFVRGNFYFQPIKTLSMPPTKAADPAGWRFRVTDKRMTIVQFDRSRWCCLPRRLSIFYVKLDQADDCATERRDSERQTAVMEVAVVPVDFELRQCGESFLAISKDISSTGMAIIHTRAIHLRQRCRGALESRREHVAAPGLRRPMRAVHRFYEIGLRFVTRLAGELESAILLAHLLGHGQSPPQRNRIMGMIKEFKEFAMKGNVVDMAVGIVIGGRVRQDRQLVCQRRHHAAAGNAVGPRRFLEPDDHTAREPPESRGPWRFATVRSSTRSSISRSWRSPCSW